MKKFTVKFTNSRTTVIIEADTFEYIPNGVVFHANEDFSAVGAVFNTDDGYIADIKSEDK